MSFNARLHRGHAVVESLERFLEGVRDLNLFLVEGLLQPRVRQRSLGLPLIGFTKAFRTALRFPLLVCSVRGHGGLPSRRSACSSRTGRRWLGDGVPSPSRNLTDQDLKQVIWLIGSPSRS